MIPHFRARNGRKRNGNSFLVEVLRLETCQVGFRPRSRFPRECGKGSASRDSAPSLERLWIAVHPDWLMHMLCTSCPQVFHRVKLAVITRQGFALVVFGCVARCFPQQRLLLLTDTLYKLEKLLIGGDFVTTFILVKEVGVSGLFLGAPAAQPRAHSLLVNRRRSAATGGPAPKREWSQIAGVRAPRAEPASWRNERRRCWAGGSVTQPPGRVERARLRWLGSRSFMHPRPAEN